MKQISAPRFSLTFLRASILCVPLGVIAQAAQPAYSQAYFFPERGYDNNSVREMNEDVMRYNQYCCARTRPSGNFDGSRSRD